MLLKKSDFPFNPLSLSWNSRVVKQKEVGERKEKEWPYPSISLLVKCEFVRQKKLWIEGKNKNNLCMGNGNPLQYSCLENPMDGGAWWATVHGSQRVGHDWATFTHDSHSWVSIMPELHMHYLPGSSSHGYSKPRQWSDRGHLLILPWFPFSSVQFAMFLPLTCFMNWT